MHPLKVDQPYPFEQWWVAAFADEVKEDILGRKILGEEVILYRPEGGAVVALSGICPHRAFPLAKGCIKGAKVQCGYHGFEFDSDGKCVSVPNQKGVPTNSDLKSYPVVERAGLVWIWTGKAENADPDLIPDLDEVGLCDGWAWEQSPPIKVPGRFTLLIDNLLDLGHASFIHTDTIPGSEAVAMLPVSIIENGRTLNAQRIAEGFPSTNYKKFQFPEYEGEFDEHFDAEYYGPCLIRTGGASHKAGTGVYLGTQNFLHFITPETPYSCHYFVISARDFQVDNKALSQAMIDIGDQIAPQDVAAIGAIEQVLQTSDTLPREVSARADTSALKVRHLLESQIRREISARGTEEVPAS